MRLLSKAVKTSSRNERERRAYFFILDPRKRYSYFLFLTILPLLVLVFLFSYLPLWGYIYAFYDWRPPYKLFMTPFVGFKWFTELFSNASKQKQMLNVLINTFAMSGLGLLFSWLPMAFAILLNLINNRPFKRVVQTLTTLPNFISWVLVYSMAFFIFSSTGAVNTVGMGLKLWNEPILFLQQNNHVWLSMWVWGTWKGLGWGAILYIAALTGIDQELYDAASVDGAGRLRQIWHVTIPGLIPTYFVLNLLSVAGFLSNGFEQYFMFQNAFNRNRIEVLDLFVYNIGIGQGSYSFSVAISIMKSFVSLTLLFTINKLSKIIRGESII